MPKSRPELLPRDSPKHAFKARLSCQSMMVLPPCKPKNKTHTRAPRQPPARPPTHLRGRALLEAPAAPAGMHARLPLLWFCTWSAAFIAGDPVQSWCKEVRFFQAARGRLRTDSRGQRSRGNCRRQEWNLCDKLESENILLICATLLLTGLRVQGWRIPGSMSPWRRGVVTRSVFSPDHRICRRCHGLCQEEMAHRQLSRASTNFVQ